MKGWKECKLGEIGTLQRGRSRHRPRYAYHLFGGNYPFIQTGEIREAKKYILQYSQTYNEVGLEQSKLWPKGTLCITIAANIAELAILSFDACFPDSVLGFVPDPRKVNLDFVYYTLTHFQRELKHIGEGSVQDNINLGTFDDIFFPFPPLPEQEAIAAVLSSLDDKIDLLHRQNKTLEAMAETLFRQWFVEEADEGWEEGKVSDYCVHQKDSVRPQNQPNELFSHYSIPAFDNNLNPVIERGSEIQSNKYSVFQNSFLFSKLNPNKVKRIWLILDDLNENAICSTEFQVVRPKDKKYLFFTYSWLSIPQNYNEIASGVGGTSGSHQRIDPADIFNFPCPLIGDDLLKSLNSNVAPIFKKVMENRVQIRTLEKLRDTLLPKLMSGEVRVKV